MKPTMRFKVESWDPDFGSPLDAMPQQDAPAPEVDLEVELPATQWAPVDPPPTAPVSIRFVDGVRRIDARVWIEDGLESRLGVCASCAAGVVTVEEQQARVVAVKLQRTLFTPAPQSSIVTRHGEYRPQAVSGDDPVSMYNELRRALRGLEIRVAEAASPAEVTLVDGPLTHRDDLAGAVGYIKTHHVDYLPPETRGVVSRLQPGQRTPLFVTQTSWSRYCCYLRLPGGSGHPWAGVVRCELPSSLAVHDAIARADQVAGLLPRFSSASHKEPRAPQNLYPIAGLERHLRRHLGDARLLYSAICRASAGRP